MQKIIDAYLEKVARGLRLSEADKNDVIGEIRNHICEAVNRQEPLESVLNKLGEPNKLARSYNDSYKIKYDEFKISDIWNSIAFYSSVALSGMFVVSILPIISGTFVLVSISIIGVAITNTIGLTHAQFMVGNTPVTTGWPQILFAIVVSAILLLIARISWSGLKKYIKYISTNYHKRRIK